MSALADQPAAAANDLTDMRNIVVVGGGFAGAAVARRLRTRLPAGYRLVLVSEESYTTFHPMLAEVVGASLFPEHAIAPLRQVVRPSKNTRFVMGRVNEIDLGGRKVRCASLAGVTEVPYDQLVLAFGNRARVDLLPGLQTHALPLKTVGDAMEIRNAVLRRLAQIELESDPERRSALGHFVILGGGFSGVEVAGELIDFLHSAGRYYPLAPRDLVRVTLIHDRAALLPEMPASLGDAALKSLMRRGVAVRLNTGAQEARAEGLVLSGGELVRAGTIVSTIGTAPRPLALACGLKLERGRIVVNEDMSVVDHSNVWALGDCAAVRNERDGNVAPPTAQFAVREGGQLAENLLRGIAGKPTRPFRYKARGMLATIGKLNGVAEIFGLRFSGLPAWLAWRAFYLGLMPTLGRKVRIYVEWTWGMFFAADITHFRFSRSDPAD